MLPLRGELFFILFYIGIGHGHAIIDRDGTVTYLRDAWQEHDDYLIDDAKKRGTNTHKI